MIIFSFFYWAYLLQITMNWGRETEATALNAPCNALGCDTDSGFTLALVRSIFMDRQICIVGSCCCNGLLPN